MESFPGKSLHFGIFPRGKWNLSQGKVYILESFPGESGIFPFPFPREKFTFWNLSQGKVESFPFLYPEESLHFGIFPFPLPRRKFTFWNLSLSQGKVYILESFPFPGKSLHFGIFPFSFHFPFPREKFYILEPQKTFPQGKKFYILELKTFPQGKEKSFTFWN